MPGVTYCRDIAEIHDALIRLAQEGRHRIRLAEQLADDVLDREPWRVGPRLVILLEEVNATMAQLKRYWARTRESGDPKESPAVDALAEILFMGRQVRLHVLLVAQSATARAIGGPEMRENFATRILVRYTLNAWRMLVPEVSPIPMPSQHNGRVQVVTRGRAQETQVLNLSNEEARAWAMSGVHSKARPARFCRSWPFPPPRPTTSPTPGAPAPPSSCPHPPLSRRPPTGTWPPKPGASPPRPRPPPPADHVPDTAAAVTSPVQPAPADDDQEMGLREAYDKHLSETVASLDALRWARANDPEFPAPVGKRGTAFLYRVSDLKEWARNRPRAGTTDLD